MTQFCREILNVYFILYIRYSLNILRKFRRFKNFLTRLRDLD